MANFKKIARRKAKKYGLNPNIYVRQINQESGFNPDVIYGRRSSPAGAQGIAQIMPATAKGWGVDPLKPRQALDAAAKHMAGYVKEFGNYGDALRAYNAGPGNVQASHGFSETNNYVNNILNGRDPGGLGQPHRQNNNTGGGQRGGTRTVTTTTPGVDNHAARAGILLQFLQQRNQPGALATLIQGIQSAQDVPATTTTKQVPTGGGGGNRRGGGKVFYVGDSLGVGTSPGVNATGRNVKVGRSSQQSLQILRQKVNNGFQGRVVFDAGTNDGTAQDLRRTLAQAKQLGVQLYVPTITGGPDAQAKNQAIRQMAGGNLHVINTTGLAPDAGDRVHYSPQGYQERAQIIQQAVGAGGKKNAGGITKRKGVVDFDGTQVAAWIAPILKAARKDGIQFTMSSGWRSDAEQKRIYDSGVRPAALPRAYGGGGSNHEFKAFPGGAVDVNTFDGGAQRLAEWLQQHPRYGRLLKYAGSKDPVHFSHPHNGSY